MFLYIDGACVSLIHFVRCSAFVNPKSSLVHSSGPTHCLPNSAKRVDVVRQYQALLEKWLTITPLINKLKRHVFANHVAIVDEEKDLVTQIGVVLL
jgi:hypothetical protein